MPKPFAALCFCSILYSGSYCQDSTTLNNNTGNQLYHSATREQEPIFSGAEYRRFPYQTMNGIIYFGSANITPGDVIYHDRQYKNIRLLYDQSTDELATVDITDNTLIRLYSPKVHSFRIYSSDFIYLPDSVNATTGGFWQILLDSEAKLLKKEIKALEDRIVEHEMAHVLKVQIKYRMFLHNQDYNITDKQAMIAAFSDRKDAVSAFLKKNRRRFRKAGFETMVTETTNYYNEISAQK
jgi:hypothetical protein